MLISVNVSGSASAFHKVYEEPIIASRQPTATAAEKIMGEARANQVMVTSCTQCTNAALITHPHSSYVFSMYILICNRILFLL